MDVSTEFASKVGLHDMSNDKQNHKNQQTQTINDLPDLGKSIVNRKIHLTLILECSGCIGNDCSGCIASDGAFNLSFPSRHDSCIKVDLYSTCMYKKRNDNTEVANKNKLNIRTFGLNPRVSSSVLRKPVRLWTEPTSFTWIERICV